MISTTIWCLALLVIPALTAAASSPEVRLHRTKVTGAYDATLNIDFFGGAFHPLFLLSILPTTLAAIPFAQPPIGPQRLRPPIPRFQLDGSTFNATSFGPPCVQVASQAVCSELFALFLADMTMLAALWEVEPAANVRGLPHPQYLATSYAKC